MTAKDTAFLPAARAGAAECEAQGHRFGHSAYFTGLLEFVPDMVTVLNSDRQIVYANRAALATAGLDDAAHARGKRPGEFFACIHAAETDGGCGTTPACRHCGAGQALAAIRHGRPASRECRLAVRRAAGDEALDLRVWANPFDIAGEPFTFFVLADISAEKRRDALEHLFLHDIMNTASNLEGFSRLLRTAGGLSESRRTLLLERVHALSGLIIDEIRAQRLLIQAEHNTLALSPEPLDALGLLRTVADTFNREAAPAPPRVVLSAEARTATLTSDPALLGRVLGNMVKNALEASAAGERVTLHCAPSGDGVAFEVHNVAVMPEAVRLQIFKRSFSTKGAGRGLGTYSIRFFTERYLKGRADFTSVEGRGTTFTVWLPAALGEQLPVAAD